MSNSNGSRFGWLWLRMREGVAMIAVPFALGGFAWGLSIGAAMLWQQFVAPVAWLNGSFGNWELALACFFGGTYLIMFSNAYKFDDARNKNTGELILTERESAILTLIFMLMYGVLGAVIVLWGTNNFFNPFTAGSDEITILNITVFVIDQTLRGAVFDVFDVLDLQISDLEVSPKFGWFLWVLITYRLVIVGTLIRSALRLFGYKMVKVDS